MVTVSDKLSESLSEYLVLTGWVRAKPEDVSLQASLGPIQLQYPFMTARMQCVVGPEMAVAAGRNGILTMVPRSLRDEDKQAILDANARSRLKKGDIEFQENPVCARPEAKLEEVVQLVSKSGHSVIPIIDRYSVLYGVYIHDPDHPPAVPPDTPVNKVMLPLRSNGAGVQFLVNDESADRIKGVLASEEKKFLPIVNKNMVLQKVAFLQKFDTNFIGMAVSTRGNWQEELEKWGPRVDTLCIDSSNACFDDAVQILRYAKNKFPEKPFGIGNIIQGSHFTRFAEEGADYIIGGMGVGSICKTGSTRGNGRGQFTVAVELARAREEYAHKRYVYLVLDGSINNVKEMTVALAFADLIMMGNYFNVFYEVAADKFDANGNRVSDEPLITSVETWGEGHPRARLVAMYGMSFRRALAEKHPGDPNVVERYGHSGLGAATVEGVVGTVPYRGHLKPCVEEDARYIRTTISNAGAHDLASFREKAVVERASARTLADMLPHNIEVTEE